MVMVADRDHLGDQAVAPDLHRVSDADGYVVSEYAS
jgi:hypothetical protein